jgi:hypothetical protein
MNPQDIDHRSLMMNRIIAARLCAQAGTGRRAATEGSRGYQPTARKTRKEVSQSDTGFMSVHGDTANGSLPWIPGSLCDTNGFADVPWAEAHGYRPSPLCGENGPHAMLGCEASTASRFAATSWRLASPSSRLASAALLS